MKKIVYALPVLLILFFFIGTKKRVQNNEEAVSTSPSPSQSNTPEINFSPEKTDEKPRRLSHTPSSLLPLLSPSPLPSPSPPPPVTPVNLSLPIQQVNKETAKESDTLIEEKVKFNVNGSVQGFIAYNGINGVGQNHRVAVFVYPYSDTFMEERPYAWEESENPYFPFSFSLPPGEYHLIAILDAKGDESFDSNGDPYKIYTPDNPAGTDIFGNPAAKFSLAKEETIDINLDFGDFYQMNASS